jgi:hypothetical protein
MAWCPEIDPNEWVLVEHSARADEGARFDLLVTDRRVTYSRIRTFTPLDPVETVSVPRAEMRDVRLRCESPWVLWATSVLLFGVFIWYFQIFLTRDAGAPSAFSLLLPLAGASCLILGRHRWVLKWRARGRRRRLVLPSGFPAQARHDVSTALRAAEDAPRAPLAIRRFDRAA